MEGERQDALQELVRFWHRLDVNASTLAHPEDADIILSRQWSKKVARTAPSKPNEWMAAAQQPKVHLSLIPVPYAGDLKAADIFVLMLNPGLAATDFYSEQNHKDYQARLIRNLRQDDLGTDEYPFFPLDPALCWTGAYNWWMGKLQGTIGAVGEKLSIDFVEATRRLARRLAVIELFPYHSKSFNLHGALASLPSVELGRNAVNSIVRGQRTDSGKHSSSTVIVTRQIKNWNVPEGPGVIRYSNGQARGASLSPKSEGGKEIIKRLCCPA